MFTANMKEVNLNAFSSGYVVTDSTTLLLNIPSWLASSYGLFACSVMYSATHKLREQVSGLGKALYYVSVITNRLLKKHHSSGVYRTRSHLLARVQSLDNSCWI
jgi:hypothetical protein